MAIFIMRFIIPRVFIEHNTKPYKLVQKVITDKFLDTCIAGPNAHGEDDVDFTSLYSDGIPEDESRHALLKVYLAIERHFIAFRIQTEGVGIVG